MDDRVDDRIERQVLGRPQGGEAFGMPQQDVQELVTDDGLDVGVRVAVFAHESQVHEQPRPLLARDRERGHRVGELDVQHFQHGANGERVLLDELLIDAVKLSAVHA